MRDKPHKKKIGSNEVFSAEDIRDDFPVLKDIVYLDSAATSLSPRPVVEAQMDAEYHYRANVGRGVHRLGRLATHMFEASRNFIKQFFGGDDGTLAFTRNTTEGTNIIAHGMSWNKTDRIIVPLQEHHSNILPWFALENEGKIAGVDVVGGIDGIVKVEDIEAAITKDTRMVAVGHASNVFGTVAPVKEIAKLCHDHDILLMVDGAQSAPHLPIDLKELGCDYFSFSGHKMLGPMGIGGLWISPDALLPQNLYAGGGMVGKVTGHTFTTAGGAGQYEAGTPNVIGAIGLAEACKYLTNLGMGSVAAHSEQLARKAVHELAEIPGVHVYTPEHAHLTGSVSFTVDGVHPHEVAYFLDESAAIMVRSGEHCCQPLMHRLIPGDNGGGTVRASVYCYNMEDDIDLLVATVEEIARMVK
ncbi:MAG TPA: cysteine desulfurase [Methanocorpusculum sp.]|nr:cysteine desulfurase [Methanocorpusculum sp.]